MTFEVSTATIFSVNRCTENKCNYSFHTGYLLSRCHQCTFIRIIQLHEAWAYKATGRACKSMTLERSKFTARPNSFEKKTSVFGEIRSL